MIFEALLLAAPSPEHERVFDAYAHCVSRSLDSMQAADPSSEEIAAAAHGACRAERTSLLDAAVSGRATNQSPEQARLEAESRLLVIEASLAVRRATPVAIRPSKDCGFNGRDRNGC
jgi:hypothetical protein